MAQPSDPAAELLEHLPPYYGGPEDPDPIVLQWMEALSAETERARRVLRLLRDTTIPSRATDEVGALSRWERALRLPVAPAGVSEAQRRTKVVGAFRGRLTTRGRDWTAALEATIGSPRGDGWQVHANTPGPNQLTVELGFAAGTYNAGLVEEVVRRKAPANQEVIMAFAEGFIVGTSRVGDAL